MCINKVLAFHLIFDAMIGEKTRNSSTQWASVSCFRLFLGTSAVVPMAGKLGKVQSTLRNRPSFPWMNPLVSISPPLIREDFVSLQAGGVC
jgi:hypothetical protein